MLNATIMNGMGVTGKITTLPKFEPIGESGSLVEMDFDYSDNLWPWSGFLACYITVKPKGADYKGLVSNQGITPIHANLCPWLSRDWKRMHTMNIGQQVDGVFFPEDMSIASVSYMKSVQ